MNNKIVLITGSTDGIGKQTAIELAKLNFHVIIHGRNEERAYKTIYELHSTRSAFKISGEVYDFSSLSQVKEFSEKIKNKYGHIDVLINNAGMYLKKRVLTEDGYETTFAVNHLAHFFLTNLLLDSINDSGRIINVSSIAHLRGILDFDNLNGEKFYDAYGAYALSKLANVLFTRELSYRLKNKNITVNALHPGVIGTKLLHTGFNIDGDSVEKGAETSVYLASSDDINNINGEYFSDKQITTCNKIVHDKTLTAKFWKISSGLVNL